MRSEKSTNGKDLIVVYLIVDVATSLVSNQEKCLSKVTVSSERRIGLKDVVEAEHSLETQVSTHLVSLSLVVLDLSKSNGDGSGCTFKQGNHQPTSLV